MWLGGDVSEDPPPPPPWGGTEIADADGGRVAGNDGVIQSESRRLDLVLLSVGCVGLSGYYSMALCHLI